MAVRPAAPRTPTRSSAAPLPKGSRVPRPSLIAWLARTIFIGSLILFFASPAMLAWAQANQPPLMLDGAQGSGLLIGMVFAQHPTATSAAGEQADQSQDRQATEQRDSVAPLLASAAIAVLTPRTVAALGKIGVLGAYLMLSELVLACWGMWAQRRSTHIPITYLLVRANQPSFSPTSGRMAGSTTPSGDQFFRAIQQAIPLGTRSDRFYGKAPWVAFTLTG